MVAGRTPKTAGDDDDSSRNHKMCKKWERGGVFKSEARHFSNSAHYHVGHWTDTLYLEYTRTWLSIKTWYQMALQMWHSHELFSKIHYVCIWIQAYMRKYCIMFGNGMGYATYVNNSVLKRVCGQKIFSLVLNS